MSTRSFIGIENPDKSITFVYCHSDGYLENNGEILQNHYNNRTKVKELLSYGNMS